MTSEQEPACVHGVLIGSHCGVCGDVGGTYWGAIQVGQVWRARSYPYGKTVIASVGEGRLSAIYGNSSTGEVAAVPWDEENFRDEFWYWGSAAKNDDHATRIAEADAEIMDLLVDVDLKRCPPAQIGRCCAIVRDVYRRRFPEFRAGPAVMFIRDQTPEPQPVPPFHFLIVWPDEGTLKAVLGEPSPPTNGENE